jgi:hypothetical protein
MFNYCQIFTHNKNEKKIRDKMININKSNNCRKMDITKIDIKIYLSTTFSLIENISQHDILKNDEFCDICEYKAEYQSNEMASKYISFTCGGSSGSNYVYFCQECYNRHLSFCSIALNDSIENYRTISYTLYDPSYHIVSGGISFTCHNEFTNVYNFSHAFK